MKLVLFLILLFGSMWYIAGSTVLVQKQCYDTAFTNIEDLRTTGMSRGWDQQQICRDRFSMLSTLNTCVTESTGSGKLADVRTTLTNSILQLIRPLTKPVLEQQALHDQECSAYQTWKFIENP